MDYSQNDPNSKHGITCPIHDGLLLHLNDPFGFRARISYIEEHRTALEGWRRSLENLASFQACQGNDEKIAQDYMNSCIDGLIAFRIAKRSWQGELRQPQGDITSCENALSSS